MYRLLVICFVALTIHSPSARTEDAGPNSDSPPLQVLHRFRGIWSVEIFDGSGNRIGTGQFENKWILDGRFIEQTGRIQIGQDGNQLLLRTLMGYDTASASYRRWTFLQDGNVSSGEGEWSETSQTLTWTLKNSDDGQSSTLTCNFSSPAVESWKLSGENGFKIEGQNRKVGD